jgi:hypothetical protein
MERRIKQGQVWIETVIYTMIGLSIIAVILAIVTPKIQETKDKALIDQSIEILEKIDKSLSDMKFTPGNSWPVQLKFDKGEFVIDGTDDRVYFLFEKSNSRYSEPGIEIKRGSINISTTENGNYYDVRLMLDYNGKVDITYKNNQVIKRFQSATLPYDLVLESKGKNAGGIVWVNFDS